MSKTSPMLHLLCGKIGSGKSTLATRLGQAPGTVVISEDHWLNALYGTEMATIPDYIRCAEKLRGVMAPHVLALLRAGTSVVLDFPANTLETRHWMRELIARTQAAHELHFLDLPDEICLTRMRARSAAGEHPFEVSEEQFRKITSHFVPPTETEGFHVVRHGAE
ncbi:AAA family ATPase [Celeribacter neptunius]|uniref:Predicted kinase n=1 Tax=Celeribacter neptunius TaxID=588602 RepID=A0A1I3NCR6_9RHOB|nr:ATP-binding protein [Celeribacter neptunius]SFJ07138.1 Predicted kinase [Celeribacter neptunius]